MQQVALIQSGSQQWIKQVGDRSRAAAVPLLLCWVWVLTVTVSAALTATNLQPAAIHGDQFAFLSSLAVFVHASDSYRLVKLLSQQTQHVNALCWSPVEANLIACSNAEKVSSMHTVQACLGLPVCPPPKGLGPRQQQEGKSPMSLSWR